MGSQMTHRAAAIQVLGERGPLHYQELASVSLRRVGSPADGVQHVV